MPEVERCCFVIVAVLLSTVGTAHAHGFNPPTDGTLLTLAVDGSGYLGGTPLRGWHAGGRFGLAGYVGEKRGGYDDRFFNLGGGAFVLRRSSLESVDVYGGLYLRFGFGVGFTEVAVGFQQEGPVYVHGLVGIGIPYVVSAGVGLARVEGQPAFLAAASVGWGFRID